MGSRPKTDKAINRDVGACQTNTIAHADEIARLNLNVVNNPRAIISLTHKFCLIVKDRGPGSLPPIPEVDGIYQTRNERDDQKPLLFRRNTSLRPSRKNNQL